jgi:Domain of unknown function (DUF1707)
MTGPQDPAAAGGDRIRAARADRKQVIEALKDAFVHGRLTREEFDARTEQALAAFADLDAVTADIPGAPRPDEPPASPVPAGVGVGGPPALGRRWPLASAAVKSGGCVVFAAVLAISGNMIDNSDLNGYGPGPHHGWTRLLLFLSLALMVTAFGILVNGVATLVNQRRSRRQLPPRPGPGGRALEAGLHGRTGHDPDPPGPRTDQTAADLRAHISSQQVQAGRRMAAGPTRTRRPGLARARRPHLCHHPPPNTRSKRRPRGRSWCGCRDSSGGAPELRWSDVARGGDGSGRSGR